MPNYRITITRVGTPDPIWDRTRHTMPAAVLAAEDAVYELHDILSTRDRASAYIDRDSARGWNPRTAELVIIRDDYTLKACRS